MEELLQVVRRLRPTTLDLGLRNARLVPGRGVRRAQRNRDRVSCFEGDAARGSTDDRELAVYRVVQEALSNVVQHADATNVDVSSDGRRHGFVLTVPTTGRGFDPGAPNRRFGITGMRERATAWSTARSRSNQRPGAGTTLSMEMP